MPCKNQKLFFKNFKNKIEHPFVVYIDFESILYKVDGCKNNPAKSFTSKIHKHVPYGFSLYIVSRNDEKYYEPIHYRAKTEEELKNVPNKFF